MHDIMHENIDDNCTSINYVAEYIEHVVVEFYDVDNYTKHAMTLDCDTGRSIDRDIVHYQIHG